MARVWKDLPPEVLENVLARFPVHVLCRLRLVCKGWNYVITQPGFASLCALAPQRGSYVLTAPRRVISDPGLLRMEKQTWEILDMAEKRFYAITDAFIKTSLFHGVRKREGEYDGWGRHTLAANGGLIYALYLHDITQTPRHVVCNPVSKSFHEIPAPELRCWYHHDSVVMLVETATQSYRIVTTEYLDSGFRGRLAEVHLYDSRVRVWRKLCEVPAENVARSCIFLEGVFYALFEDTSQGARCNKLYSCDLETGAWSHIDHVRLPQPPSYFEHEQSPSQLVASLGRLFFVEYTGPAWKKVVTVGIWEILLGTKQVTKVAEMPKFLSYDRQLVVQLEHLMGNPVVALGCGNSIIISSFVGRRVRWDMLKNCWYKLPLVQPMHDPISLHGATCLALYAASVDLDLREMSPDGQ